jgi:3-oxoacyl-[acyl-carrier-protein] synthase II
MSSSTSNRRVVITGLGVISPLGNSVADFWDALCAGRSGVTPLTILPPIPDLVTFAGQCTNFNGEIENFGELDKEMKKSIRKALKVMCRETIMAVAAAQQAMTDAKLAADAVSPDRSGIVYGSDYMLSPPEDFASAMIKCGASDGKFSYADWGQSGLGDMNPLWMLKYLPNMPASHIAIINDLRGPNNSLTLREVSSMMAVREAMQTIQRGHADLMLAGSTGTRVHSFKTVHAVQTEQLANPGSEPAEASRPFDANRTGMVVGEGAGAVVLEEYESAKKRGATIYGELVGSGSSIVTNSRLEPNQKQAFANAARTALAEANISGSELGHVNAHALGTKDGDAAEAAALGEVLGEARKSVPVTAAKSYFGNLGAGSGVVELVASTLALYHDKLFRTLNYTTPDAACPVNVVATDGTSAGSSFLKLSITPQAQAAAVVVKKV